MDVRECEINKCRICLEENVDQHWNEIIYGFTDLTYKDCYYKYTQLEYLDEDNFYAMLCRNCSNSLEFIEAFISKAIKTQIFLQKQFRTKINIQDDADNIKHEPSFEIILVDETESNTEIPTYEDSNEEFITTAIDREACSREERCSTPLTQSKKQKKRKPKRTKVLKDPIDHNVNGESLINDKNVNGESLINDKNVNGESLIRDNNVNGESLINDKKNTKKAGQSNTTYCCSICSKVLSSKYKVKTHEKTHIENRERTETCFVCGLKFYNTEILRSHMRTHVENREKPHKCEFCDKAFYNKGALNVHRRIHLGQMISCALCSKKYSRQFDLEKHMASHSAAKISSNIKATTKCFVKCKHCGKTIRTASYRSHTAKHENEPLCKCSICNKEFFRRNSCLKHLRTYHKKTNEERINLIIEYKKNRVSHLFLQQNTNLQVKYV